MPDRVEKFLRKLNEKEREVVKQVVQSILDGDTQHLDQKKLRGRDDIFRVRKGDIRIIYRVQDGKIFILLIERRSDNTYRDF